MYLAGESNCVIVYRKSRKEAKVPRINLIDWVRENSALLLRKKSKRFASRSDQREQCKTLLHDIFDWFLKSGPAREPQKILSWALKWVLCTLLLSVYPHIPQKSPSGYWSKGFAMLVICWFTTHTDAAVPGAEVETDQLVRPLTSLRWCSGRGRRGCWCLQTDDVFELSVIFPLGSSCKWQRKSAGPSQQTGSKFCCARRWGKWARCSRTYRGRGRAAGSQGTGSCLNLVRSHDLTWVPSQCY